MFEWKFMQIAWKMDKNSIVMITAWKMNPEHSERWPIICAKESNHSEYIFQWMEWDFDNLPV